MGSQSRARNGQFRGGHRHHTPPQPAPTPPTAPTPLGDGWTRTHTIEAAYAAYNGRLMTTGEAAKLFGVAASTVRKWCEEGRIRGYRFFAGSHWRVDADEVHAYLDAERTPTGTPRTTRDTSWDA